METNYDNLERMGIIRYKTQKEIAITQRLERKIAKLSTLEEKEKFLLQVKKSEICYIAASFLIDVLRQTKNKGVIKRCIDNIDVLRLLEIAENCDKDMVSKLAMSHSSLVIGTIMRRDDFDGDVMLEVVRNSDLDKLKGIIDAMICKESISEDTLWQIANGETTNYYMLSRILASDKVSRRIIKKLEENEDEDIQKMALARDPDIGTERLDVIVNKEIRKCKRQSFASWDRESRTTRMQKTFLILTDILEAAMNNPVLSGKSIDKIARLSTEPITLNFMIPHKNISLKTLEMFAKNGTPRISKAATDKIRELKEKDER